MKKLIFSIVVILNVITFTACNTNQKSKEKGPKDWDTLHNAEIKDGYKANTEANAEFIKFQEEVAFQKKNEAISKAKEVPVGEDNFKKLVYFIEKNGFVVPQNDVPCDHQYTFIDSKGNRHAMITIKRDDAGNPSMKGTVNQISVWAYHNGIKKQENFFGYKITTNTVGPYTPGIYGIWKEADDVKLGYEEFLKKVNK